MARPLKINEQIFIYAVNLQQSSPRSGMRSSPLAAPAPVTRQFGRTQCCGRSVNGNVGSIDTGPLS
jgi:hypothetical protein